MEMHPFLDFDPIVPLYPDCFNVFCNGRKKN